MSRKFEPGNAILPGVLIFVLRNLVLMSLVVNAYLHFKGELNLVFILVSFVLAVILAVWMERVKIKLVFAVLITVLTIVILRFVFFFVFRLFQPLDSGLEANFLYFYFDKDFFPSLIPCAVAWLFNFFALRYRWFIHVEAGLNSLFLAAVFATEAQFNITIYHPTFLGIYLTLFVLIEVSILILSRNSRLGNESAGGQQEKKKDYKLLLSYLWVVIPLILLLVFYFILMDMYNKASTKARGGLMESTLFRFDFSKYIKLESEIKLSDDLILIFRKNGHAKRLLLRRFILSKYDPSGGFYMSPEPGGGEIPTTVPDTRTILPDPKYADRDDVSQEYYFVNLDPTSLIAMNYPVTIIPLKNWDESSFLRIYRVVSRVSQYQLSNVYINVKDPVMPSHLRAFYTDYGNDKKIKELAEEATADATSYFDKVEAIDNFLADNYLYSLKPGLATEGDENQLHHFLFTSKKGYCSYFAFAMALMCRSLGIPARVAVGFYVNPDSGVLNFYEIREKQAHAWVEVYFGDAGWIEFDPTSTNLAPGEDLSFELNFEMSDKLKKLISEILQNENKLTEEQEQPKDRSQDSNRFGSIIVIISSWLVNYWYIALPVLYFLIVSGCKLVNLFLYASSRNPRSRVRYRYKQTLVRLFGIGLLRKPDETILEYAQRIGPGFRGKTSDIDIFHPFVDWTNAYLKAVFDEEFSDSDYKNAMVSARSFDEFFGVSCNPVVRVLGFLNPVHVFRKKV
jgi:transglutaminase-like putative cysteine protease